MFIDNAPEIKIFRVIDVRFKIIKFERIKPQPPSIARDATHQTKKATSQHYTNTKGTLLDVLTRTLSVLIGHS